MGYVSPDFRDHVVGSNFFPLLREHDQTRFDIFCYANVLSPDAMTRRLEAQCAHWRNIAGCNDQEAAEAIRADRIDILVDLALHTAHNRLPLFARKPAPVQVSYLGYCGTTGLEAIDHRLSDPYLDPPGTDLGCYSERTICLPHCTWCYQPGGPMPEISPLPALRAGFVTFGCRNNFAKVSSLALDLWLEILLAVPRSRLVLYAPAGACREALLERFVRKNITAERLQFIGKQPWEQFVRSYQAVDIALDPFPYCGWITTCDALWMGVPVISLSGRTAVGRGGCSILSNIGLPELVAQSPQEYVEIAVSLAGDLSRLVELRATLRERMERSPLRDAKAFARDIEAAYRQMWRTWCLERSKT